MKEGLLKKRTEKAINHKYMFILATVNKKMA